MSEFKKRFQRWMNGEKVYEAGKILPEVVVTADDPIKKLVEDVNARSNADFVNRVKDPNRTWIQDWEHDGYVATHKLSWAEDSGKAIVFPNVQNINGELHDFTDPKYNHGKWDALDSAIERGDTLLMTPELAKMYTENYKKYYPKGKTFDAGKPVDGDDVRGYDTENKIYVQKEINWMRNWLNARRDILEKNADAVGYGYSKYTPKNTTGDVREAGWNVERYGNPWNPFTYFNNSTPSRNRVNKLIYSQIENAENTPKTSVGHGLSSDYNMRGVYVLPDYWDNGGNYIAFAGIPDSGVKIHELTHASHPLQQEYYILDNVFNGKVPQVVPNHKRSDLDNAKELYGALLQFRYENKLDPKYKVTQEWINKNRDLFKGTYLENIKDSDKLKLFNDVAQNNINTKRLYYADNGKSINPLKKYDGGKPVEDDYEKFKRTLPPNQRNASEYDYSTRRYWELNGKPKNFDEAVKRKMYILEDDGFYHANSIAWTQNGDAEFMKPNVHPTKHFEDEFYESNPEFLKKYRRTFDWTRPGFSKYERNINPLDYINLPKYDGGTDDKTYFPEYEYEVTVTPQGTSLEKHKRITNEEDWLKYWGNVGAGYVNLALESVAKPILEGLKEATYFTPFAPLTSAIDTSVNLYNGNYLGAGLSALAGIPMARVLYNKALPTIGRLTKPYTNYFASKALSNAIDDAARSSLNGVKANAVREMFPTEDEFNFWHGGLDSDFDFKDLDVLRLGSKQAKKGRDYAGFYMYDSFNQPGAFRYGGGEAHGIKIADNAKIFNADFNTERLSVDELTGYLKLGYDLIKGKNVFGEPEYILLNKDVIKSTKFFENFPGHRINMLRPPRTETNPKNLTNEELVLHWNKIVNDLSVDKKAPQSVIDLFDNTDLPKTAKSGAEKFVLRDPNNSQYVLKKHRGVLLPKILKRTLEKNAVLNYLQDLVLPTEYIGSQKIAGEGYIPYFRQLAIKSLDGKDAALAGKEWPTVQRQGYEAFKNWLDIAKQNPKYSVEDGRVITEFGHIGDVGPQGNIGVDANGNPFAFDPMLFDANWEKIFNYLYGPILYDKGKSIYINPANKGKFNATKKRTGKTTEQLAHSKNPLTRKRAVFALNSRKFKH